MKPSKRVWFVTFQNMEDANVPYGLQKFMMGSQNILNSLPTIELSNVLLRLFGKTKFVGHVRL